MVAHEPPGVDISAIPELVRLVEGMRASGQPRTFWRGGEEVALLSPPRSGGEQSPRPDHVVGGLTASAVLLNGPPARSRSTT